MAFTFRSFACSGARIDRGVLGSYAGVEPVDTQNPVAAQIDQATAWFNGLDGDRRIDALVMNIGGNNLGFGKLIAVCANVPSPWSDPCNPPADQEADRIFRQGIDNVDEGPKEATGLDDLPSLFARLDRSLDREDVDAALAARPIGATGRRGRQRPRTAATITISR